MTKLELTERLATRDIRQVTPDSDCWGFWNSPKGDSGTPPKELPNSPSLKKMLEGNHRAFGCFAPSIDSSLLTCTLLVLISPDFPTLNL